MAKLNRFIMNSDYDSLKIIRHEEINITIPSAFIDLYTLPSYVFNFQTEPGVVFSSFSAQCSDYPNTTLTGRSSLRFDVPYDSGQTVVQYKVYTGKTSSTNYRVKVDLSFQTAGPQSTTTHAVTLKIKLNLLVPSEQQ